jgi:hypothetical protein
MPNFGGYGSMDDVANCYSINYYLNKLYFKYYNLTLYRRDLRTKARARESEWTWGMTYKDLAAVW